MLRGDTVMPKKDDWRHSGQTTPQSAHRDWHQKDDPQNSAARPQIRIGKKGLLLASLGVLLVVFALVVLWFLPLKPACLVVIGSGYEENLLLPHNAHGVSGLLHLEKNVAVPEGLFSPLLFGQQPSKIRRVGSAVEPLAGQSWAKIWDKVWNGRANFREDTLIVFISMHAMADDSGAYLLANDSAGLSAIPFDDVLASVRELSDQKKNVVILLDVCQVQNHWPIGMLHNDFAMRLKAQYESKINEMGHVLVVCSAS